MRRFVTFVKKLTVLATLFALLQGVCIAESSKQDFSDPRETSELITILVVSTLPCIYFLYRLHQSSPFS